MAPLSDVPRERIRGIMMSVQKSIVIKGYVQGVSYRKQTAGVARNLGVTGWVRNVSNGSVEALLEGEMSAVDALISWCAFGPKRGRVDEVEILMSGASSGYSEFTILEDRLVARTSEEYQIQ